MKRGCLGLLGFIVCTWATGVAADDRAEDRAAIQQGIDSYVAAFNARDAQKLVSHWSPEGVYTSRLSGEQLTGREALEQDFAALFKELKDVRLEVSVDSIDFISPNVALERGTAKVIHADGPPDQSSYSVVHVQRDGKWLIDRVSEEEDAPDAASHYEHLKDLEWMIGEWVDQAGEDLIKTECEWTRNQNFITRAFTVSVADSVEMAGMQVIGWDPAQKQIRSWVFDSDGGFAEATWKRGEGRWIVQATATLADGTRASYNTILRPLDENSFAWQKINRVVDGEILPNIDEVVIVRKGT